ncbi:unnamed protein product [Leptosia nina]|uniref:Uncharacterized protein n=1 Tax=Leptosia nina TaxID=320188 RepID=A0AAV1JXT5_9NEOP
MHSLLALSFIAIIDCLPTSIVKNEASNVTPEILKGHEVKKPRSDLVSSESNLPPINSLTATLRNEENVNEGDTAERGDLGFLEEAQNKIDAGLDENSHPSNNVTESVFSNEVTPSTNVVNNTSVSPETESLTEPPPSVAEDSQAVVVTEPDDLEYKRPIAWRNIPAPPVLLSREYQPPLLVQLSPLSLYRIYSPFLGPPVFQQPLIRYPSYVIV